MFAVKIQVARVSPMWPQCEISTWSKSGIFLTRDLYMYLICFHFVMYMENCQDNIVYVNLNSHCAHAWEIYHVYLTSRLFTMWLSAAWFITIFTKCSDFAFCSNFNITFHIINNIITSNKFKCKIFRCFSLVQQ